MGLAADLKTLYDCNPPTKRKAYLFLFLGNSMVDGFSSDYTSLLAGDIAKYFTVADMTQYKSFTGRTFINKDRADFTSDSNHHGTYASAMIDLYDSGVFSDGDLFCFQVSPTGTSIINGEGVSWSVNDSDGCL